MAGIKGQAAILNGFLIPDPYRRITIPMQYNIKKAPTTVHSACKNMRISRVTDLIVISPPSNERPILLTRALGEKVASVFGALGCAACNAGDKHYISEKFARIYLERTIEVCVGFCAYPSGTFIPLRTYSKKTGIQQNPLLTGT
jgi:hypothetical protein